VEQGIFMARFLFSRFVQCLIVLLVMSFVIYGLIGLMPGDPIDLMITADPNLTAIDASHLRELYGLDRPIIQRYGHWLLSVINGDLGYSRLHALPVLEVIGPAILNSIILLGLSFALALLIALPLGIIGFWENGRYLVLPVISLTIASLGTHTRYIRASMMEALRQDYIRTARAKGSSEGQVVIGHALRNAMIPVVTVIALDFGYLFSGALITETIFSYPGMGKLIFDSIMGNDFNLALIALLFATALTLCGNFLADVAYAALDRRISLVESSK
jgi:peptide/nickel transport system permease protein